MQNSLISSVTGVVLAVVVLMLAVVFALRQWRDRFERADDLSEADREFFQHQDRRRGLGSLLMVVIAVGMAIGLSLDPYTGRPQARIFVIDWIVVLLLLMALVVLATRDWLATRNYASRHRRELIAEARALAEAERRLRALMEEPPDSTNGKPRPNAL